MTAMNARIDRLMRTIGDLGGECHACRDTPHVFYITSEAEEQAMRERLAWRRDHCTCPNPPLRHVQVVMDSESNETTSLA